MRHRTILFWSLVLFAALTPRSADACQDNLDPTKAPLKDAGTAAITGRIMLPSGFTTSSHVKLVLSNTQAPIMTLYTDPNGEFGFSNLQSGTFYLQVIADETLYEPMTHTVKLTPGEPAHLVLYLKLKNGAVAREPHRNTVSVGESEQAIPSAARQSFDLAHKLIDKGDIDGAIAQLQKAVAIYPDYISARNSLGVQHLRRKHLSEAAEQFRAILEKNSKYYDARLNLGIVLVEQKQFNEAIRELSQAVTLDSSRAAAHLFWGIAALNVNDLETAERELVKALLFGGEQYSNAHYYFAHVYLKTGRREEAARELTLFLKTAVAGDMADQARALLQQLSKQP